MNTLHVETVPSSQASIVGYLLINKAAKAIAMINPTPNLVSRLNQYTQSQDYSLDWVLLTYFPKGSEILLSLQSQYSCVFASSIDVIQKLPESLIANCEPLENNEIVMLGHLKLEVSIAGQFVNYQIGEHIFVHNENSIETKKLESLVKLPKRYLIHLIDVNSESQNLNHEVTPEELKRCLVNH